MKRIILATALTIALAAPAFADMPPTTSGGSDYSTGSSGSSGVPATKDMSEVTPSAGERMSSSASGSAVDMTIKDLQTAKDDLNKERTGSLRDKVLKQIDVALHELETIKSRESKESK